MKNDKAIIRYLDNQMSDIEKERFEKEINNSPNLQKEIEDYKILLSKIEAAKIIDVKEEYLNNIVPNFRARLEKKNKARKFSVKLAYAGSTLTALVIAAILFFGKPPDSNKIENVQQLESEMTSAEIAAVANNYLNDVNLTEMNLNSSDIYDSVFTKMLGNELTINSNTNLDLIASNDAGLTQLEKYINDENAEAIYNEIMNKQFFKE